VLKGAAAAVLKGAAAAVLKGAAAAVLKGAAAALLKGAAAAAAVLKGATDFIVLFMNSCTCAIPTSDLRVKFIKL
jgi:hypothetical protein